MYIPLCTPGQSIMHTNLADQLSPTIKLARLARRADEAEHIKKSIRRHERRVRDFPLTGVHSASFPSGYPSKPINLRTSPALGEHLVSTPIDRQTSQLAVKPNTLSQ